MSSLIGQSNVMIVFVAFRIGRRKASVFCTVWMVAFGIGSAFSPNWEAFASIRFFIGVAGQVAH